jgi:hypothetical protein
MTRFKFASVEWLLEKNNPSVRYFTLTDILGKPAAAPEVQEAKAGIMETGVLPKILARQKTGGYWERAEDFYIRTKYRGTVWQLIVLAELGADGNDERIRKACEFILDYSQERERGGFAYRGTQKDGGDRSGVIPCLTGNMVWSLVRLGYAKDPRVKRGIDWITAYQRFDDGIKEAPGGWPYSRFPSCWGKHTCHLGIVKALKAFAEIPLKQRSKDVNLVIERAAEYLLRHHLYKRSHDLCKVAKPRWLRFGFPTMWNTDVLEMALILTRLGYQDGRMADALDLIVSKQNEKGIWLLEESYTGRFRVNIERKGKPSKWITLRALKVLQGASKTGFVCDIIVNR